MIRPTTRTLPCVCGAHVELIVRCHFPPGYAYAPMFDDLHPTIMVWGNWNDTLQRPSSNRWWLDWPFDTTFYFEPIISPTSFFTDLDDDLIYTGTTDGAAHQELELHPNPASNRLNLGVRGSTRPIQEVEVIDLQGHRLMQVLPSPCHRLALDVSSLPQGLHFVRVRTASGTVTRKFLH